MNSSDRLRYHAFLDYLQFKYDSKQTLEENELELLVAVNKALAKYFQSELIKTEQELKK